RFALRLDVVNEISNGRLGYVGASVGTTTRALPSKAVLLCRQGVPLGRRESPVSDQDQLQIASYLRASCASAKSTTSRNRENVPRRVDRGLPARLAGAA